MPASGGVTMGRVKTEYVGVYYRLADRIGGKGRERVYYVTFKKDGKTVEAKAGRQYADSMTAAKAARYRAELIEGKAQTRAEKREAKRVAKEAEAERWTIDRLWVEYQAQRPKNKALLVDANRFDKYLKADFGSKEPDELIQLDIDRLRLNLLKKLSPQTVAHVLGLLKRIVNFGVNKGLCPGPGFKIQLPRVSNEKTEDLSPKQLEALLRAIDATEHKTGAALMRLALFTGMRRGEMFKLRWSDIDFDRGFILLRDPKGGTDQRVPLNDEARKLFETHPRTKGTPLVFPGRGGRQLQNIRYQVNSIKEAAGLPKEFRALHGLRHVYASMLASSGRVDLYQLQRLLTHKTPRMTQRYAHLRDEALKAASAVAGDIISEAAASAKAKEKVVNLKDRQ
jgi:integrase